MKRIAKILAVSAIGAGAVAATAGAASAAPLPHPAHVKVAVGNVALSGPLQYESFVALQNAGHNHGWVSYTNFTYAETGSGVWAPVAGPHTLTAVFQGTPYAHTLNGGLLFKAESNNRLAFTGTGEYNGGGDPWHVKGDIRGNRVDFTITYDSNAADPGYVFTARGVIHSDGSATGTAVSSENQAGLTWTLPAGTFGEVLHYVAPLQAANVNLGARNASFRFTIPNSVPVLNGIHISERVHDGGRFHPDTYAEGVTGGALSSFPITSGNIYIP